MLPYFAIDNVLHALFVSIAIAVCVLLAFGYVKAKVSGCSVRTACASALQTLLVGVVAASASYGIVRATNELQPEEKAKGS